MALRLYFNNETPDYTPTPLTSWNDTSSHVVETMKPTKAGPNSSVTVSESVTTNNYTLLHGIWVTDPFTVAATIPTSDSLALTIGRDSSNQSSFGSVWRAYVVEADGVTIRGTLIDLSSTTAWAFNDPANGGWSAKNPPSSVSVQRGDRLVFEMGVRTINTTSSSRTATIWFGNGGGADFDLNSPDTPGVETRCGWTEVTGVMEGLWVPPPVPTGAFLPFLA